MTDKIQKIREEVEKLKSQLLRGACSSQVTMETRCKEEAYNEVLAILDTMQEEPASEELEEASRNYTDNEEYGDDVYFSIKASFQAGAKWHKEQMMAKAIDGYVIEDVEEGNGDFLLSADYLPKSMGLKDQQRVKVIVIKEG